jgi:RimJ/RimL family protein N-acetyltransferase
MVGRIEELRGDRVRLRPLRREEERVLRELRAASGFPDAESPGALERFRTRIDRSGELADGRLWLAIDEDGELAGDIEARAPVDAFPAGVFELGIALFPERQGRGLGTDAVATLTEHLVRALDAARIQASTSTGNARMQRLLERLGFVREGVLRAFMPGAGGREDYVLYALTRSDWEARS